MCVTLSWFLDKSNDNDKKKKTIRRAMQGSHRHLWPYPPPPLKRPQPLQCLPSHHLVPHTCFKWDSDAITNQVLVYLIRINSHQMPSHLQLTGVIKSKLILVWLDHPVYISYPLVNIAPVWSGNITTPLIRTMTSKLLLGYLVLEIWMTSWGWAVPSSGQA